MLRRNIEIEVEIDDFSDDEVPTLLGMLSSRSEKLDAESVTHLVELMLKQGSLDEIIRLLLIAMDTEEVKLLPIDEKLGMEFKFNLSNWKFVTLDKEKDNDK